MVKRITIIIFFISNGTNNLFAQYDLSAKFYYTVGKISPDQLNSMFTNIHDQNKLQESWHWEYFGGIPEKIKNINNINGFGFGLSYEFSKLFGIDIGYNEIQNFKINYNHWGMTTSFLPQMYNDLYRINFKYHSFHLAPFVKYGLTKYWSLNLSFGAIMGFGEVIELYLGEYPLKSDYYLKKIDLNSQEVGYQITMGSTIDVYDRISFSIEGLYKNNKLNYQDTFSLTYYYAEEKNKSRLEFDVSGYFLSAGLKIGIL